MQGFLQVAADDIITKGKMLPERFPVYFEYADELHFYWTYENFLQGAVHAATYIKNKELQVHNPIALAAFIKKYDIDRTGSTLPSFQQLAKIT